MSDETTDTTNYDGPDEQLEIVEPVVETTEAPAPEPEV